MDVISIFNNKPKFEVIHSGRGGVIQFNHKGKTGSFNIEMGPNGNFFVFTGRSRQHEEIRKALKEFLVASDRSGWIVDE